MTKYVVGFAFDTQERILALILKARPDWQKGLFNGVGGHVEEGETPQCAMSREWAEETQSKDIDWTLFAKLSGDDFEVYFFRGNGGILGLDSYSDGESIEIIDPNDLPLNVVSNLRWLIPMAKIASAHDWPYQILEHAVIK